MSGEWRVKRMNWLSPIGEAGSAGIECGEESGEAVHGMTRQPNQFGGTFRSAMVDHSGVLPLSPSAAGFGRG